jgi:hypothetical protein
MTRLGLGCAFDRPKAWRSVRCGLEPEQCRLPKAKKRYKSIILSAREVRDLVGVCRSAIMVRFHAFGDDVR